MKRVIVLVLLIIFTINFSSAFNPDDVEVWFAPDIGSEDMLNLFTNPEQWPVSRELVDNFLFFQENIFGTNFVCAFCGQNSYENLVSVGAFTKNYPNCTFDKYFYRH